MKKYYFILLSFLCVVAFAGQASAAAFRAGERYHFGSGESVTENLYVGAGEINLAGSVAGDLIAGGGNVIITGRNEKDVMVGGGSLNILGPTKEDLRLAGGNIIVGEDVGGDLAAAGGMINILSGTDIGGEAWIAGGSVVVDGTVAKDLVLMGEEITVNGKVSGNVRIKYAEKITIGSSAVIGGNLEYSSKKAAVIMEGAQISGETTYNPISSRSHSADRKEFRYATKALFLGIFTVFTLIKLLIILSATLLLVYLFKENLKKVTEEISANFWPELLRGLVVMVTVPAAMAILMMTIVGLLPAIFVGFGYGALMMLASVYSGIFFGALLFKWLSKEKQLAVNWKSAVLGVLALALIGFVPYFGWIICLAVILVSLGGLSNALYRRFWQ